MGSAAVGRFGEVAGVGEEDCFSAVMEDVGKELGRMRIIRLSEGCGDGDGDRRSTGATGGRGLGSDMCWREGQWDADGGKFTDDGV